MCIRDRLYITQSKIIEELAEKGKCVSVGRCADYIPVAYTHLDVYKRQGGA